jgi:hypothetical protein
MEALLKDSGRPTASVPTTLRDLGGRIGRATDVYLRRRGRERLRLDEMFGLLRVITERLSPEERRLMYPYQEQH